MEVSCIVPSRFSQSVTLGWQARQSSLECLSWGKTAPFMIRFLIRTVVPGFPKWQRPQSRDFLVREWHERQVFSGGRPKPGTAVAEAISALSVAPRGSNPLTTREGRRGTHPPGRWAGSGSDGGGATWHLAHSIRCWSCVQCENRRLALISCPIRAGRPTSISAMTASPEIRAAGLRKEPGSRRTACCSCRTGRSARAGRSSDRCSGPPRPVSDSRHVEAVSEGSGRIPRS